MQPKWVEFLWEWLESLWCLLESHLLEYTNLIAFSFVRGLCFIFMHNLVFFIVLVRLVLEGGLASLYGVVWAEYMCGVVSCQ